MKIDRKNPTHWLYFSCFTFTVVLATLARALRIVKPGDSCLLYGHKLNGNLKAVYAYSKQAKDTRKDMFFLTMDYPYSRYLQAQGLDVINGINPFNALKIARAYAVISDHGLHSLSLLLKHTNIPFFDVWHAIPLKGFDENDFRPQHQYEKVFVTSERVRRVYVEKFGFKQHQVVAAGYARTDMLVANTLDVTSIKSDLGITDTNKKIFLFAPTWQQDDPTRTLFPFGAEMDDFFSALDSVCTRTDSICIFRTHLNSGEASLDAYQSILFRPHSHYPDTEEMLLACDCLVSDWSSIVFDYMLLDRPTIFLDVPHPFAKGFSLGPEHRFGKRVSSLQELQSSLETYLLDPAAYTQEFGSLHEQTKRALYDDFADGNAAQRVSETVEQYWR